MYLNQDSTPGPGTRDPGSNLPEHVCWETVEAVRQEWASVPREVSTSGPEGFLADDSRYEPEDTENMVLYLLWNEMHQISGQPSDMEIVSSSYHAAEPEAIGQIEESNWDDKTAVAPRRVGTRKIMAQERSQIQPVSSKQEFGYEEDEWRDTAAVTPRKVGTRKIRIRAIKELKPTGLPGEFDPEED